MLNDFITFPGRAGFFCAAILICWSNSLPAQEQSREPPRPAVVAVPATTRDVAMSHQRIGQVVPDDIVELVARVEGYLVKRCFEEGSQVKKGDLVFLIEQEQYKAELEAARGSLKKAQAALVNANVEFNRYTKLTKEDAVAQKTLDAATMQKGEAEGDLLIAQRNLSIAELNLSYTEVRAPFDGKIGVCPVYEGNLVGAKNSVLTTLVRLDPVKVEFPIPEAVYIDHLMDYGDAQQADQSTSIRLLLPNGKEYSREGRIYFSDNRINNMTGSIILRARFPNPDGMLVPGGYVKAIVSSKAKKAHLLVPQEAIQRDQTGAFVLVMAKDGGVERRSVTLGTDLGRVSVVESGLAEGELVITEGTLKVRTGVKPKVTVAPFPEIVTVRGPGRMESSTAPRSEPAKSGAREGM